MTKFILAVVLAFPLAALADAAARADLKNAAGDVVAAATLEAAPGGVELTVHATKLPIRL